jgi:hypothetical protein
MHAVMYTVIKCRCAVAVNYPSTMLATCPVLTRGRKASSHNFASGH